MSRWYTADLHLEHEKISEYCGRPFDTVSEMNDHLVEMWNDTVADEDHVIIVGDVCMGQLEKSIVIAEKLRGRKVLIAGNHDPVWVGCETKRRMKWDQTYRKVFPHIFTGRSPSHLNMPMPEGSDDVIVEVCHFPFFDDSREDRREEFDQWRPIEDGQWLLHGHVHHKWLQRGRQINVGIDAWGGQLVSEDMIVRLIQDGPQDLEPLSWQS